MKLFKQTFILVISCFIQAISIAELMVNWNSEGNLTLFCICQVKSWLIDNISEFGTVFFIYMLTTDLSNALKMRPEYQFSSKKEDKPIDSMVQFQYFRKME